MMSSTSAVENYILSQNGEKTFQYDDELLTMPVPDLSNSLKNYLESVKPLVPEDEYRQTEIICKEFELGVGRDLQKKLCEKAKGQRNWLEQWWEDVAYLEYREPLALINMGGPGPYEEDVWPAQAGSQLYRAAMTSYFTIKFWQYIRREQYKPMRDNKGRPMCMYQFRRVFNSCRIPGAYRDKLYDYFKTESEGDCPSHMIVLCKGHMFVVNVLDEAGEVLTPLEFEKQFSTVRKEAERLGPPQEVNYLTSLPRTPWAEYRNILQSSHPSNYDVLEKIQSAILCYSLEEGDADSLSDLATKSLIGNVQNKWCDKSMSMVAYRNGRLLCNADHSFCEGIMMVYLTGYIHQKIKECNGQWQGTQTVRPQPPPALLKFVVPDELRAPIEMAKAEYKKLQSCATCKIYKYEGYGKAFLKKVRIHPDAHAQLSLHLTFYTLHGRMAPAYETAPIKHFYHGRTETLRSCTMEAFEWCKSMLDSSYSNTKRWDLYNKAVQKHNHKMAEAMEMRGCDRHLMGLYLLAKEENLDIPKIFYDPSFVKSGGGGNYLLSTSTVGYSTVMGGVLPMCKNCYGAFYRINDNMFTYFLSTWNADEDTSCEGFAAALGKSLDRMKDMMDTIADANARL